MPPQTAILHTESVTTAFRDVAHLRGRAGAPQPCARSSHHTSDSTSSRAPTLHGEKLAEGVDQGRHMITSPTRNSARVSEHQSRVPLPCSRDRLVERCEVLDVLGDDGSSIRGRSTQQFCIRKPDQFSDFFDRNNVVAEAPQLGRNGGRVHLVKQKPHPDSSWRSRSQAASSRSAASSLWASSASISSVNSA